MPATPSYTKAAREKEKEYEYVHLRLLPHELSTY
jgi:hypothetical protein